MLASVAWRSFNSSSILASVALAFSICTKESDFSAALSFWKTSEATYRLGLERLNSLDVCANVVRHRLELLQNLLSLIDDSLVLEHRTVVCEVDGRGLRVERAGDALGVAVPLPQGLQRSDGFCWDANVRSFSGISEREKRGWENIPLPRPSLE